MATYTQSEGYVQLAYCNLYVLTNLDSGEQIQLTNLDIDLTVTGTLPSGSYPVPTWTNGTFLSSTASHASIKLETESQSNGLSFTVVATNPFFQNFFITAPTSRIILYIYRCDNIIDPDFTNDVSYVFVGELNGTSFAGSVFNGAFSSVSLLYDKPVPRIFYQRLCNHNLYGVGCTVNPASYSATITVTAFSRYSKLLQGTISGGLAASLFGNGYLIEPTTNSKIGIVSGAGVTGSPQSFYMLYWIPQLESVSTVMTIQQGCDKTANTCQNQFNNLANFLGYPRIPSQNPSYDS